MIKVLYLAGGYPSRENPAHGVFNQRAAESLKKYVDLTVVQYRILKPGRRLLTRIEEDGFCRFVLAVPFIPLYQRHFFWLNNFIFRLFSQLFLDKELKVADVVHASDGNLSVFAAQLRDKYGFKLLGQFIGGDLNQDLPSRKNNLMSSGWPKKLDVVTFNSRFLLRRFRDLFGTHSCEHVIYRGVDVLRFYRSKRQGVPPIRFYFLGGLPNYRTFSHGRNTKGGYTLMRAWSLLDSLDFDVDVELHMAGPDSDIEEVTSWKRTLAHPERVNVHGRLSATVIPEFHQSYDVLIAPSMEEGMPNAVMEACAIGNLTIGSLAGGIPELLRDGETGILVPCGDERALMSAMQAVILRPSLIRKLGDSARVLVESSFNSKLFGERYFKLYQSLASKNESISNTGNQAGGH